MFMYKTAVFGFDIGKMLQWLLVLRKIVQYWAGAFVQIDEY